MPKTAYDQPLPHCTDDYVIDDIATVARECGISTVTLRRAIWSGHGPVVTRLSARRLGIQRRHRREWLDAHSTAAA